jgi:hypothetical protein
MAYMICQTNNGNILNMPKMPKSVQFRPDPGFSTPPVVPRTAAFMSSQSPSQSVAVRSSDKIVASAGSLRPSFLSALALASADALIFPATGETQGRSRKGPKSNCVKVGLPAMAPKVFEAKAGQTDCEGLICPKKIKLNQGKSSLIKVNQGILKHFYFTQKSTLLNPTFSAISLKLGSQTRQAQSRRACRAEAVLGDQADLPTIAAPAKGDAADTKVQRFRPQTKPAASIDFDPLFEVGRSICASQKPRRQAQWNIALR